MAQIACRGLSKRFGETKALADVTCELPSGEALMVVGPSGAGKTTFLRMLGGLEQPDSGTIEIGGRLCSGPGVFIPPHERGLGFVFQRPTLWPHLNATENVALALIGRGLPKRERHRKARSALAMIGMDKRLRAYPATLSGGEMQRVGLARALVVEPSVLLLDEPFVGLDICLRRDLREILADLKIERGVTLVWVSQRPEDVLPVADRILLMRDGAVLECGLVKDVLEKPADDFSASFLHEARLHWTAMKEMPQRPLPAPEGK